MLSWHGPRFSTFFFKLRFSRRVHALLFRLALLAAFIVVSSCLPGSKSARAQDAAAPAESTTAARLMQAANSRVALVLPPVYQAAKLYSGFEDERRGISFVIFEAPWQAYDEMRGAFTPETLASRGLTDGMSGQLARQGDYVYMQARQSSPAGTYAKFFVLFRTTDQTVLVSANVPIRAMENGGVSIAEIEHVLASARTVPAAQIRDLYRLNYLGPFKEAGRVAGTSKLFTLDGRMEPEQKGVERAALIVAPSIDKRAITDINVTAKTLLQTLGGYRNITIGVPEPITISGMNGVALKATAVDAQSDAPLVIYQVLLAASDGGYYRLVGLLPQADAERLLPEVVRMTLGFELLPG